VQQNLDDIPVVLSGMASSSIGLKELPYCTLPVSLDAPGLHIETIKQTRQFLHNIYLISGIRTSDDVMRGEETQLLGLSGKHKTQNGVYVLPGTHSKHIFINNRTITDFKTYVTGELFELLATQSILSDSISKSENFAMSDAFQNGCEASLKENLLHSLFTVRSRHLLQKTTAGDNYGYLSGLLIGSEMSSLAKQGKEPVVVAGEEPLLSYYSAACKILKLNSVEMKLSSDITAAGHRKILNNIQN
jgi:2-dehydro-3-deoxygalactonokinase